nr:hypothetical protein [Tanacetum cinerariifolium]
MIRILPMTMRGRREEKERRNAGESSSKSSKKDKALMDSTNDDILADQPQDKVKELIQDHPNSEWFSNATKKSGLVDAAKKIMVVKKVKELIKKDELTIADLEDHKIPYSTTGTEEGVVYLNMYDVKSLILREKVHKLCDGTLVKVQDNLEKMLKENKVGNGNENLMGIDWTKASRGRRQCLNQLRIR